MPSSGIDWGQKFCTFSAQINVGASKPGCEGSDVLFTFVIFQLDPPGPAVASLGLDDCCWVMELFADGIFLDYYLIYSLECQLSNPDANLAWIMFPDVNIGGLGIADVHADFSGGSYTGCA